MANENKNRKHVSGGHHSIDFFSASPVEEVMGSAARQFDPFGVTTSLLNAQTAWLMHPQELSRAAAALSGDLIALQAHIMRRALGMPSEDVVEPHADDKRFADPVWKDSATWDIIKELYLAFTHRLVDMYYETPGLSERESRRSGFWLRKWMNAVAPTNFFWLNPVAMRRCVESHGESLVKGFKNFVRDAKAKNIRMVDENDFKVGQNLATTPGSVVHRNRLVELIHYAPTTDKVHATPIVIITPWINKFYILDLTPQKSLVKYLTDQGFSVIITSWKNPREEMANVTFDDYLLEGVDETIQFVTKWLKVPQVALVGYCIGGTLVSAYMSWANRRYAGDKFPIACWTLFTTLTDFAKPGDIEIFIDEDTIRALEQSMAKTGYLDGSDMASSFRLLRSNSLIWHYFVNSYLYGEPLQPFDVLFWNVDSTRMPCAMHSFYLREMYLHNKLIKRNALTIAGEPIDFDNITQPLYAVTAEDDHIAPWKYCYRIRRYINVKAPMRFVLSTSGHILGIVNPPANPPKRSYWAGEPEHNESYEQWRTRTEKRPGTWWGDWLDWLRPQCGPQVAPPNPGSKSYPKLGDAPGTYVLE